MHVLARALLSAGVMTALAAGQAGPALTPRALENLQAFTRLFGYVRYFHPSDAAAQADWEQLAIRGIGPVEGAKDSAQLASRLTAVLGPAAAAVRVYPTGSVPSAMHLDPGPYLIEWRHHGVGLGESTLYYSERVTRRSTGDAADIEWIRAELPGGVSCEIPRVLYTRHAGVFRLKPPASGHASASGDDRTTRLAAVILALNVPQHFYPYFDVVPNDWPRALTTALTSAATDKDAVAFLSTLRRMMASLHDGQAA